MGSLCVGRFSCYSPVTLVAPRPVWRSTRRRRGPAAPRGGRVPQPELYRYEFDLADVTEVWRRGSVVASWLLDLTAQALAESPDLADFSGRVADSGEGRWTLEAAIDESVPAPVLSAALFDRFRSRGEGDFADKLLSALRFQFGGHREKAAR
jgi:6-phosphogluconate dehydrogenase